MSLHYVSDKTKLAMVKSRIWFRIWFLLDKFHLVLLKI